MSIGSLEYEFPDYGPLNFEPPADWEPMHWHNNTCPAWCEPVRVDGSRFVLWVEYEDKEKREYTGGGRFSLCLFDVDFCHVETVKECEDYAGITEYLKEYAKKV